MPINNALRLRFNYNIVRSFWNFSIPLNIIKLALIILTLSSCTKEPVYNTFGGVGDDIGLCIHQTFDGGSILVGSTRSAGEGGSDVWLLKTDSLGNLEWDQTYGGDKDDVGYYVEQTADSGYVIAASSKSFENGTEFGDIWIIKVNVNGEVQWSKTFWGKEDISEATSVKQTQDGGFVILGSTASIYDIFDNNPSDICLIKLDSLGIREWDVIIGKGTRLTSSSFLLAKDGGYVILGWKNLKASSDRTIAIIKTNQKGEVEWFDNIDGYLLPASATIINGHDSGYVIVGTNYGGLIAGQRAIVLKYSDGGDVEWESSFSKGFATTATTITKTKDNSYVIGGSINPSLASDSVYAMMIKLDSSGKEVWSKQINENFLQGILSIDTRDDGDFMVTGVSKKADTSATDILFMRTDRKVKPIAKS